ncbi:hypothetical protein FA15DRAFT_655143 [Coprinopsis marcescibilis]|uniref:Uncharacterized protein n=1 Tax=Coprinopsis marcescibilis TaxID=230819 RepID=A0A5C3KY24_COPMA|nr:hypothetical protein FA15DRAFT_655143 [Coprinopsis marcescibilis]
MPQQSRMLHFSGSKAKLRPLDNSNSKPSSPRPLIAKLGRRPKHATPRPNPTKPPVLEVPFKSGDSAPLHPSLYHPGTSSSSITMTSIEIFPTPNPSSCDSSSSLNSITWIEAEELDNFTREGSNAITGPSSLRERTSSLSPLPPSLDHRDIDPELGCFADDLDPEDIHLELSRPNTPPTHMHEIDLINVLVSDCEDARYKLDTFKQQRLQGAQTLPEEEKLQARVDLTSDHIIGLHSILSRAHRTLALSILVERCLTAGVVADLDSGQWKNCCPVVLFQISPGYSIVPLWLIQASFA